MFVRTIRGSIRALKNQTARDDNVEYAPASGTGGQQTTGRNGSCEQGVSVKTVSKRKPAPIDKRLIKNREDLTKAMNNVEDGY